MNNTARIKLLHDYRILLRHARSLPSNILFKETIVNEFRKGKKVTDRKEITHLHSLVSQYVTMISSIKELEHLRSLDSGEKLGARDKIKATAARVGLGIPKFADDRG